MNDTATNDSDHGHEIGTREAAAASKNDNHNQNEADQDDAAADDSIERGNASGSSEDAVIENIEAVKKGSADSKSLDGNDKGGLKVYPMSYFDDSENSSTYNENWDRGAETFAKEISKKLQSKYRMRTDGRHNYISQYVDMMFPDELETVVTILVNAGHILFPMTCDYDDCVHDDILAFFERFCSQVHISCEEEDEDPGKKSHVSYLYIDDLGLEYTYGTEIDRDEDGFGFFQNLEHCFDLDECIERLVGLRVLRLSTHCLSLPETLANLKLLHRISIVDTCEELTPVSPDKVSRIVFPSVTMIHIETGQRANTEMSGPLRSLLLTASFPSINELSFEIDNDATQIVPDVVKILETNTNLQNICQVSCSFYAPGNTNQDKDLIPNFFLDLMPQISRVLPKVDELTLSGKEGQLEGVIDVIAKRLQNGDCNKPYIGSFCDALNILEMRFGTNSHAKEQKESMMYLLHR